MVYKGRQDKMVQADSDLFKETLASFGKMIEEKTKAAQRKPGDH
jgi:hypothetical protein